MNISRSFLTKIRFGRTAWISESVQLLIGSLIAAFAVNVFYVPVRLTMGGVSGIASIIYQLTGQGNFLSFGVLVILLNIPLLLLGWRMIDLRFIWRSLIGTVSYSFFIDISAPALSEFYTRYINRPLANGGADPLIFCLFGGVLYGIGLGLIFRGNYTTGGTDILAIVIKRRIRMLSISQFLMIMDAIVVIASVVAYRDDSGPGILMAMYSFIAMYLTSKSMDIVLEGFDYCRAAYIISDKSDLIAGRIMQQLQRGVTSLHGRGMYTGRNKDVLLCVLSRKQVPDIKLIVGEIDPDAFVIVVEAREVLGEGFGSGTDY
ncbi:MAG: YitT family protein [Clostridiaceae bacterium]|nr:YitT family protein [Clostridiaceae bacterium]